MSKKALTESEFILMGWILLEYELVYFLKETYLQNANQDWIQLRDISDEMYDKKVLAYNELAKSLGKSTTRPIGSDPSRPSVRMIIDKFSLDMFSRHTLPGSKGKIKVDIHPLLWPDIATETDDELTFRARSEIYSSSKIRVKRKQVSRKKVV